jgi:hypothetical protein
MICGRLNRSLELFTFSQAFVCGVTPPCKRESQRMADLLVSELLVAEVHGYHLIEVWRPRDDMGQDRSSPLPNRKYSRLGNSSAFCKR